MEKSDMRVLHLSTWDRPCGIATYCGNLVRGLDDLGNQNNVYSLQPELWKSFVPSDIAELQEDIAKQARGYDLVHIQHEHGIFGHGLGYKKSAQHFAGTLRALQAEKTPVAVTFHTDPLGDHRFGSSGPLLSTLHEGFKNLQRRRVWRRGVSARFGSRPDQAKAIVHTMSSRRALIRHGMDATAVHVINHGCLPPRDTSSDGLAAKAAVGLAPTDILLTMFGFVSPYKGHDLAIQCLERLPDHVHLAICGGSHPEADDDFLASLIGLVHDRDLDDRVTITGWLTPAEADKYYAATDICLAPYTTADLSASGAITWALASGKPIIGSKIPAFRTICREQPCMLLTTPGRVNEIVWAVEKLTASPDAADRLVTAAREYVEAHTWQETAGVTSELYSSMLSNASLHAKGVSKRGLVDRVNSSRKVEDLSPQRSMRVFPTHEQENAPAFSTTRQRRAA
jgi:glycosyltransferase involved in cell wall biosynthesis